MTIQESWNQHQQEMLDLHISMQKDKDKVYNSKLNKRNWFQKLFNIKPDMSFVNMCQTQQYICCVKDINERYAQINNDIKRIIKDDPIMPVHYLETHNNKQLIKSSIKQYINNESTY